MYRPALLILSLLWFVYPLFPQNAPPFTCASDDLLQQKLKNDPAFQARHEEMEQQRYQWLKGIESLPQQSKGASPAYVIPVVVHIIHQFGPENITDIQVEQGIQHLNAAFANSGYYDNGDGVATPFQFCLARRKPDGSPTNGINRVQSTLTFMDLSQDSDLKNLSRWDPTQYVNIWVIKKISGNIAGYAFFPGSHGGPEDGIVMEAEWMGSSFGNSTVLAHEMGHYLGLYHTFQNGCYNNNCLLDGDKVCDTPPDQSTSWTPCGTVQNSCVTDTDSGFATDQNDMTINYMDYATWDCYNAFTQGQSDRMEFFLLGARQSLLLSQGCNDPCIAPVTASFSASASGTLPAGTVVNFTNTSVNGANYEWTVNGNVVGTSANLNYVLANAGTQVVLLKVWGSDPSCTDFAADTFFVVCPVVVSFSADKPNPAPGETITCTYTGSGATLYEWLLNGVPVGSAASVAIPIPGPGSYSICLNASNGFCQQQTCRLIEVADTNQCFESWWKKLDLNASSGSFGGGFVQLPGGDMLAGAVLDYANQHFVRFSPLGVVTQHWNIVQQNVVSGISDFSVSSDGHVLVLRSNLSGNSINNCFMEKINYATGQVAWSKRLMLPQPMFVWKIEEHPATQHYWIWGRVTGTAQQLPTDQAIVLEINPADGNILSQKNYSIGTAPLVKATVPAGNFIYGAGYHYTGAIGFKPMLAKFDMTGALVWSKQFDFAPLAFVEWTDVARDGDHILLTGADGNTIFFTKTDLDGNPLEVKSFNIGGMLSYYSHADKVNINVLSDGYLLTFGYFTSAQDDGRMVFLKIDKSGNIDWAKNTVLLPEWDGVEVLINGGQIVAMACQGFHGDDLYLFKTPIAPATPEDCAHDQPDITASVPAWTLSTFMPAPLNAAPVGSATLNTTTQNISVPLETLCAANACPEICGNGLDDDSDGYVDCFDASDCPCDDLPECIRIDTIVPPDTRIAGKLDWASPGNTAFIGFTPVAANLNPKQDNMPEIVAGKWVASQTTDELLIFRGDGSDAATPRKLIIPERLSAFHPTTPAIGDLDGDGIPELAVICADHHMRVYNNYQPDANPVMTLMAVSTDTTLLNRSSKPLLADFDANGISEIYLGNEVFWFDFSTPGNPALRRTAPTSTVPSGRETHDDRTSCSIAADLLSPIDCAGDPDCEGLEIAAGYAIYSVDLDPSDGDPVEIKKQRDLSNMPPIAAYTDGHTTVGDVDLDGILDILVTGRRSGNMGVYIWNKNGLVKFIPLPTFGSPYAGLVAVGNVYDDKLSGVATDLPEMVVCAWGNRVYALNINAANQTPATPWWWTLQPPAGSGFTSAALFDFNNDGFAEVVVRDLDSLSILYGGPAPFPPGVNSKRSWFSFSIASSYLDQYPTVADADNDGQAEVVLIGRPQAPSTVNLVNESIVVLEADVALGVPWAPARPLWNQFNYYPVSINDDLSIPTTQQPSHFELPGPGSGKRPYNLFLGQPSKYDNNFNPFVFLPDAGVSLDAMRCNGDTLIFTARICNKGSTDIPAETPLRLYAADPTTSTTAALPHIPALPLDIKPDSCLSFEIALPAPPGAQHIYLVVNDNGNQATPFDLSTDFPVSSIAECDYSNNMAAIDLPLPPPLPPDLGPDVTVCQNGVWTFDAGPGFESYKWSDLTTEPSITVYEPGIYWVEARDVCGNVYSDTVSVTVDAATAIELGTDTILCGGGTLQFNVPGFVEYQWFPVNGLSCSTCGNPGAQPSADVTYTVVAKTALGCYSTDSIKVTIGQVVQIQLDTAACAGETLSIHGTAIHAGSSQVIYLPSATGCDSVLNVAVAMLPVVQTAENQTICAGDSALIFGQWQSQAGAFSQTFTASGGCDSTHTVALDVLPALQTTESRAICAGDSALIFGQWQNQAGAFSQTFTASGGCDSTHTVALDVLPALQTTESRAICAGDSALIFGQWQSQAGAFSQTFTASGGCDSTHTVALDVLPALQTSESRAICVGDSTLIFGQWQSQAGAFSQTFTASGGCDSTHTVALDVLPALQTTESRAICAGDSALIFGQWQNQAGAFSQTFTAMGGCDSTHTVALDVLPALQTTESRAICAGDSALIFGQWQSQAGAFSQTFTATGGCDSTHTVVMETNPLPDAVLEWSPPVCPGESNGSIVAVSATTGLEYSLNGSDFQGVGEFYQLAAGDYILRIRDSLGCRAEKTLTLPTPPLLFLELPGDTLVQPGQPVQLSPLTGGGNLSYAWSPAQYLDCFDCTHPVATPLASITYTLTIQNAQGCSVSDSIRIRVEKEDPGVFISNALRPGSSNGNDLFTVFALQGVREVVSMEIYDRWGGLMFRREHFAADGTVGWDGTARGKAVLPGVYVYLLEVELGDGTRKKMKGDVTVLR